MRTVHCMILSVALLCAPCVFGHGILAPHVTVGESLEVIANFSLDEPAPPDGVEVTLTSADAARLRFSKTAEGTGTAILKLNVRGGYRGSPDFYIQGFGNTGSVTYTATAAGYTTSAGTVTLAPSGVIMARSGMGLQNLLTTSGAAKTEFVLYSALLDPDLNFVHPQPVAAGPPVSVTLTSSDPKVGGVASASVTIPPGSASAGVEFRPLTAGVTILSLSVPQGFTAPAQFARVVATVIAPGMAITDNISVGNNLEAGGIVSLGEPAPSGGTVVTLTSGDSDKLLVSPSAGSVGSDCIRLAIPPGGVSATYLLQALKGAGEVTYTASAPGFRSRTASIALTPSGLVIGGPQGPPDEAELLVKEIAEGPHGFVTHLEAPAPTIVTIYSVQLDPVTRRGADLTVQPVRAGQSIQAALTNSNPAAGTLQNMNLTIAGGTSSAVTHFTPASVGVTEVAVTPPAGYTKASNSTLLTVTVREKAPATAR
jgi:hypothetical protein